MQRLRQGRESTRIRNDRATAASTSTPSRRCCRTAIRSCWSTACSSSSRSKRMLAHQERHHQRAVLPGPLPRPSGDAGRADHRGAGAGRRPADPLSHQADGSLTKARSSTSSTSTTRRFKRRSCPGDQLQLEVDAQAHDPQHGKFTGVARVDGEQVACAELLCADAQSTDDARDVRPHDPSDRASSTRRRSSAPTSSIGAVQRHRRRASRSATAPRSARTSSSTARRAIGRDNRIFQFASIGGDPQDKKFARRAQRARHRRPQHASASSSRINRGTGKAAASRASATTTGSWPTCTSRTTARSATTPCSPTTPRSPATWRSATRSILGGFAGVHQFCRIGAHAFIGMGCLRQRRRAAVRDGRAGRLRPPARHQRRGPEAPRLRRRAHRRDQARLPALYISGADARRSARRAARRTRAPTASDVRAHAAISSRRGERPHAAVTLGHDAARIVRCPHRAGRRRSVGRPARRRTDRRAARAFPRRAASPASAAPRMRAAGFDAWHDADELAVHGPVRGAAHLPRLLRAAARRCASACCACEARRLHRHRRARLQPRPRTRLKQRGIRTVHFVSPSIWAWRESRAAKIGAQRRPACCACSRSSRRSTRATASMRASSAIRSPMRSRSSPTAGAARAALGLPQDVPVLALLPGSAPGRDRAPRRDFLRPRRAGRAADCPTCASSSPMATPACARRIERTAGRCRLPPSPIRILDGHARTRDGRQRRRAARLRHRDAGSDARQAADGRRLSHRAADARDRQGPAACSRSTRYSLPNVLAGERVVPELMQDDCTPVQLADAVLRWFHDPAAIGGCSRDSAPSMRNCDAMPRRRRHARWQIAGDGTPPSAG